MAVGGCILWFATLIIWIVLAVIFGPPDGMELAINVYLELSHQPYFFIL